MATGSLWSRHQQVSVFGLRFLQMDNHPVQIITMAGRQLLAHLPDFFQ
jgi:hypothetical protein